MYSALAQAMALVLSRIRKHHFGLQSNNKINFFLNRYAIEAKFILFLLHSLG